jgi:hypothetical protein
MPLRRRCRPPSMSIAGLYTLVATCGTRGINAFAYLTDVLPRVQITRSAGAAARSVVTRPRERVGLASLLCQQLVGRCRYLWVVRERVARSTPSIASVLHASKVANHLGEPRPHRPSGVWLASPRGDPRLLHEIVSVVSIVRERSREAFQPGDVLEQLLSLHFGHDPILTPESQTLPRIR